MKSENRTLKSSAKIKTMRLSGAKLAQVRRRLVKAARPGMSLEKLDQYAEELIINLGAEPAFKFVPGYQHTTCINLNQGIVHGIPGRQIIQKGDLLTIDVGVFFQGYYTDGAVTVSIGAPDLRKKKFLAAGRKALKLAISSAKAGKRIADISKIIQANIESEGYSCSRSLTGHGVGKKLHEEPLIPCVFTGNYLQSPRLKTGQTLAIEVIYVEGNPEMILDKDGWTLSTKDQKLSAVFEETILITARQAQILTQ